MKMNRHMGAMAALLCTAVALSQAFAQEKENPFRNVTGDEAGEAEPGKKAPEALAETGLKVSRKICNRAVRHVPDADVAYQPGVDAYGNPVAPADIPGSRFDFDFPDEITFDLALNPLKFAGNKRLVDLFPNAEMSLGTIKYSINSGKMTLDGRPLSDEQTAAIAAACKAYSRKK